MALYIGIFPLGGHPLGWKKRVCIQPPATRPKSRETTTTNFVDRSVNAKSCDGSTDGWVKRALANGMHLGNQKKGEIWVV